MTVAQLKALVDEFSRTLREHSTVWGRSLDRTIPEYPIANAEKIRAQSQQLSRMLGRLRPFLLRFRSSWTMHHPATGTQWDALESAVGMETAVIKGDSIRSVLQALDVILGQLDNFDPEDEVPVDVREQVRAGGGPQRLAVGYLEYLHPFVREGCSRLYLDGHYAQATEESVKAVLEYLRRKTGVGLDGAALVDKVFGINAPILRFGDLTNDTVRNEQVGLMDMLKGFVKGVRHPLAHTHGRREDAQKAFEYLAMASLFCRRIDEATPAA